MKDYTFTEKVNSDRAKAKVADLCRFVQPGYDPYTLVTALLNFASNELQAARRRDRGVGTITRDQHTAIVLKKDKRIEELEATIMLCRSELKLQAKRARPVPQGTIDRLSKVLEEEG